MKYYYSTNKNVQLLIALLKAHGIKKVIASPGTTNLELMGSMQHDGSFEMYSCIDERSAAYMACGLAEESGEPVVITCTEATASRDYLPGLTEAYHRKLPVLAITGMHGYADIGQLEPQVIDRSVSPLDSMRLKVNLPVIKDQADIDESVRKINQAILELKRNGGGPVHINMPWGGGNFDFSVQTLPEVKKIERYCYGDRLPGLPNGKIIVFAGTHHEWSQKETAAVDAFCKKHNAVVFCDHSSKFYGSYRFHASLLGAQKQTSPVFEDIRLMIHIGEESGDSSLSGKLKSVKEVWRVSPDGEIRDTFHKLTKVFEMRESYFFDAYAKQGTEKESVFLKQCIEELDTIKSQIPELPFSSIYAASVLSSDIPDNSVIHFGASDSIRAWNMFDLPNSVRTGCNTGCRGIDGSLSSIIGASFVKTDTIYYCVVGDLTFFYDMNALGNRYVGNNLRIMLTNNSGGNIFRHYGAPAQRFLGFEEADKYIAAGGHYGGRNSNVVKNYVEALGFEYLSASNKEELKEVAKRFLSPKIGDHPMLLEIFTTAENDSESFLRMSKIIVGKGDKMKSVGRQILGTQGTEFVKRIVKR